MKLIIYDFDTLEKYEQEAIQDYIAGITTNFDVIHKCNCDVCSKLNYLNRVDTDGGIIRLCASCIMKKDTPTLLVETKEKLIASCNTLKEHLLITDRQYEILINYIRGN